MTAALTAEQEAADRESAAKWLTNQTGALRRAHAEIDARRSAAEHAQRAVRELAIALRGLRAEVLHIARSMERPYGPVRLDASKALRKAVGDAESCPVRPEIAEQAAMVAGFQIQDLADYIGRVQSALGVDVLAEGWSLDRPSCDYIRGATPTAFVMAVDWHKYLDDVQAAIIAKAAAGEWPDVRYGVDIARHVRALDAEDWFIKALASHGEDDDAATLLAILAYERSPEVWTADRGEP